MAIGPFHAGDTRDIICRTSPSPKIVHHVPGGKILLMGVHLPRGILDRMGLRKPTRQPTLPGLYYSSASLEDVRSTRVFHDQNWHRCGVLIEYKNGAQQAVGQCRIGIDDVEYTESPRYLFLACFTYLREGTKVQLPGYKIRFAKEAKEYEGSLDWYHMTGVLELWFSDERAMPKVIASTTFTQSLA